MQDDKHDEVSLTACGWCCKMDVHVSKKCGQSQLVWYCNEECQLQAWPEHKKHCHKRPAVPKAASALADDSGFFLLLFFSSSKYRYTSS